METLFDWPDIDIVATMSFPDGAVHVDFACYEVIALSPDGDGNFTVRQFERKGAEQPLDDPVTMDRLAEAQPLLHGTIKWDACSHVYFGEADNAGYIHLCGAESWRALQIALERIFAEAGKLLKRGHNDEFFETA